MMLVALFAAAAAGQPHSASADDWAQCLWQSVPTSAANWIEMPIEQPIGYQSTSKFQRLKFRLRSACWDQFVPKSEEPGLVAEPFGEFRVREALIRSKPIKIAADRIDPSAWVCQAYKGDQLVAEYFNRSSEMRAKLQKSPGHGVSRMDCNYISADGSLKSDA